MKLTPLFIALMISVLGYGQNEAEQLLEEVSNNMASYSDMHINFSYTLDNNAEDVHQETTGEAFLKGDLYHIEFLGNIFIYDGSQSIVIIPEDEEINISEGNMENDEDGLMTPSKLFSFYKEGYRYELDITQNAGGINLQYIKLIPIDSNSEVGDLLLGVDVDNKRIHKLIQTGKDGIVTTFSITKFSADENLDQNLFEFDRAKYEALDYIINDSE